MSVPLYQAEAGFFRMPGHPARIRVPELLQDGPVHGPACGDVSDLLTPARRILAELPAGRSELPGGLRETEVTER
ncbi:hypothetical protein [Streptomyces scabiei]|uniref:hypothetical protein n=1 Tax=Streptomyces scabiei TaxID=1930 RepID=UPI0029B4F9B6|nr:hypothetical protein [Streptomyces scabiei]MDX3518495.1 hypothetical protein [Streptomyces scabiei]